MTAKLEDADALCGGMIARLLRREDLSEEESWRMFRLILDDKPAELQQGAFLAALTAKGETAAEIAGGWRAVDELDTIHPPIACHESLLDTCGTGMDSCKTFNISTLASLLAAAAGARIARHGARAITSRCGTVDLLERLGVDCQCPAALVAASIERAGIGLFNGMSQEVHPRHIGRLLQKIRFGSPLNLVASLANPARPGRGLRGVHSPHLLRPVAEAMMKIGYRRALVVCGGVAADNNLHMDEVSVCGLTRAVLAIDGVLEEFSFTPEEFGISRFPHTALAPAPTLDAAARSAMAILAGRGAAAREAMSEAVALNAAFIIWLDQRAASIAEALAISRELLAAGAGLKVLRAWVAVQQRRPPEGLAIFDRLRAELGDLSAQAGGGGL
ncbi:MAG: anthranilate phosphoribosyltransferase [Desulfobulbaceae bacterium]|jgi:anthranilate phosphoribosyltransferase|nr:anthranilate phosphoribosyltransferase [Desulfobulbaceae bacterium]